MANPFAVDVRATLPRPHPGPDFRAPYDPRWTRPVGPPPAYPPVASPSTKAVLSVVFGGLALLGLSPLAVPGAVLGWLAYREPPRVPGDDRALPIVGLVLNAMGLVGLLVGFVVLAFYAFFLLWFVLAVPFAAS